MAGTLTISTLSDGTNSTSSTNCIQGSAKVWICYNGVASTISASYNVSSVTKNGSGNYTLNFTNALSDTNYCAVFGTVGVSDNSNISNTAGGNGPFNSTPAGKATSSYKILCGASSSSSLYDINYVSVAIFR